MNFPVPTQGSPLLPPLYLLASYTAGFLLLISLIFLIIHFRNKTLSFAHKAKEFLVWLVFLLIGIAAVAGYLLLPAPQVVSVSPAPDSIDNDLKSPITIQFNRPVSRRTMEKTIGPDVPGVWIFEDQLYTTHFYKKVVFYPDIGLDSNTTHKVELKNIKNTLQTSQGFDYSFSFKTKSDLVMAKAIETLKKETFKLPVPVYLQQHTLSCELASLKMTLAYKGIMKSEEELLSQVGVDTTAHVGNEWGNPYEQFVGNVDGKQMRDGYGVYWGPIERVAKLYGGAQAFQNGDIKLLTSNIASGNPVIIWVYSRNGTPTRWKTPSGVEVFAVAGEHTVVAVGFVGSADNPSQIIVNDSLVGQVYWSRSLFNRKWASFSQSGVIVYK
ncbi:C39 family peptidase [Candidatus Woesebacteria bacterium]|nr:C39 family peptidase [Candidatus Woesebacteria bacterium]